MLKRKRGRIGDRRAPSHRRRHKMPNHQKAGESAADIAKEYGIGRSTVYKIIKHR